MNAKELITFLKTLPENTEIKMCTEYGFEDVVIDENIALLNENNDPANGDLCKIVFNLWIKK